MNDPDQPIIDGWDSIDTSVEDTPAEVPNLDTMDVAELHGYAGSIPGITDTMVRALLYRYCMVKADAILNRLAGRMDSAGRLESQADAIYQELPTQYRW